ncbi:MAG: small-conductance mechanosensitive channel [Ulvibacter sp.]|jgi:small-conductance mechanosensitive channel
MEFYQSLGLNHILVIETIVTLIVYFVLKLALSKLAEKTGVRFDYQRSRVKVVKKIINLILFVLMFSLMMTIWGVDQSKLIYFITSLLTVVGIAFFAQWSIISNITSSLIIFFNHTVRIGDTVKVMDKEFDVEGRIMDIGVFFLIIKNSDGEEITMPSNLFMQKMVKKIK